MRAQSKILAGVASSLAVTAMIAFVTFRIFGGLQAESRRMVTLNQVLDKTHALHVLTAAFKEEESARSDVRQAKEILSSLESLLNITSRMPREQVLIEQLRTSSAELGPLIDLWFDSGRAESGLERGRREMLASQIWMKVQFLADDTHRLIDISQSRVTGAQKKTAWMIVALIVLLALTNATIYWVSAGSIVRAQRAVRESEERLRLALGAGRMVACEYDPATLQVFLSENAAQVLELRGRHQNGNALNDLIHPEDVEGHRALVTKAIARGGSYESHYRHGRDGGGIWVEEHGQAVVDPAGKVVRVVGVVQNITERKRAEEALRKSEGRWNAALESFAEGAIIATESEDVVYWNPAAQRMHGFKTPEEGIEPLSDTPKTFELWTPDGSHLLTLDEWPMKRIKRGESVRNLELRLRRPDQGWERFVSYSGTMVETAAERLIFLSVHDLTEQRKAEQALRESERRLTLAQEAGGVGVYDWNVLTGETVWTSQLEKLYGIEASEARDKQALWLEHVHPDDRQKLIDSTREWLESSANERHWEYRFIRPDGQERWLSGHSLAIRDSAGRAVRVIVTNTDITEQKNFQTELERLVAERTARLQELVGELEHFSYTITHDLKSPLRAMRGFAEVVQQIGVQPEAKPFLEKISMSAERMDSLIADALSYSRSVRQELPLQDVDAGALLRGIMDSYPQFQPWRAQIQVEEPLPMVLANEAGLTQVFSNLLGNAVKFVKPGEKPAIRVWATEVLAHGRQPEWVRIWVEDKGIGISRQMLPRVFDMFSRGSKEYEGTGIGLALVRKVVQRMGGRVGVESEEGKGSRFWIELGCGEARPVLAKTVAPQAGATAEATVLYVEDEESDAMFMERAFSQMGLKGKLRVVGTGRAAIDYLSGSGEFVDREKYPMPTLVLLDLNLPQVSGFGVLTWIRNHEDYARLPVVMFSSSSRQDDRARAKELGADEFVTKPSSGLDFGKVVEGLQRRWLSATRFVT